MNLRPYVIASLVLNLGLTGSLLYRAAEVGRGGQTARGRLDVSRTVTEIELETTPPYEASPAVQAVAPPFNWRQIESADYKTFIANLKGVGCPPTTIRDIIEGAVKEQYLHLRATELAGHQSEYWNAAVKEFNGLDAVFHPVLEKLRRQRDDLLTELLGRSSETGLSEASGSDSDLQRLADYLPTEKQQKLVALEEKYRDMAEKLRKAHDVTESEQVKALEDDHRKALEELLTPAELDEYRLRNSTDASWAKNLRGFQPTEQEFHAIAKLQFDYDSAHPEGKPDGDDDRQKAIAEQERKLLGNQRFAELQRAQDTEFQLMSQISGRYQLPAEVANTAYGIKQTAEQQATLVSAQADLSDEARQAALAAIQAETLRTLQKTMGDGAWQTYQRYSGGWLTNLVRPASPNP